MLPLNTTEQLSQQLVCWLAVITPENQLPPTAPPGLTVPVPLLRTKMIEPLGGFGGRVHTIVTSLGPVSVTAIDAVAVLLPDSVFGDEFCQVPLYEAA